MERKVYNNNNNGNAARRGSSSSFFSDNDYQSSFVSFNIQGDQDDDDCGFEYSESDSRSTSSYTTVVHTSSFASSTNTSFASDSTVSIPTETPRTNAIRNRVDKLLVSGSLTPRGIIGLASGFAKPPLKDTKHGNTKNKLPKTISPPSPSPISSSGGSPRTAALRQQVDQALSSNSNTNTKSPPETKQVAPATKSTPATGTTTTTISITRPAPAVTPRTLGLKGVIDRLLGLTPSTTDNSNSNDTSSNTNTNTNTIASAVRNGIRRLSNKKKPAVGETTISNSTAGSARTVSDNNAESKAGSSKAVNDTSSNTDKDTKAQGGSSNASASNDTTGNSAEVRMNLNMNKGGYEAKKRTAKEKKEDDGLLDTIAITDGISRVKIGKVGDGDEKNVRNDEGETADIETEMVGTPVKSKSKVVPKKTTEQIQKSVDELTDAISRVKISDPYSKSGMPVWLRSLKGKQLWHDAVAIRLFHELDREVFGAKSKLRQYVKIEWNALFRTTAGTCELIRKKKAGKTYRLANIKLSQKVLDVPHRLYTTLAHEMCHAAAWILDDTFKPPHGKIFKKYTQLFAKYDPQLNITTCHSYDIRYKYNYQCTWCKTIFGRHSQKIDTKKKNCSCGGDLKLLKEKHN